MVAIIGAVGLVVGAAISNMDKIGPAVRGTRTFTVEYEGYKPTGIFETEFRYYFEVSGLRSSIEDLQGQLIEAQ